MNIETSLIGRKCHYRRKYAGEWHIEKGENEIVEVLYRHKTNDKGLSYVYDSSCIPLVWYTIKNSENNLVTKEQSDVILLDDINLKNYNIVSELQELTVYNDENISGKLFIEDVVTYILKNYTRTV